MTAAEPIAPIHAWVPDLDAARYALAGRGLIDPKPEFREMHLNDVRAVLDASGANAEVESLRALLHAAHHVIATLRAENTELLEVALQATSAPVDLAADILRRIAEPAESVAAPGHVDGWQASAELIPTQPERQ